MLVDKTMDGGCPSPVFMCQNEMQRISQTLNTNVFVTSLSRPVLLKHIFCLIPPNSTGFHCGSSSSVVIIYFFHYTLAQYILWVTLEVSRFN